MTNRTQELWEQLAEMPCLTDDGDPDGTHPIGCDCAGTGRRFKVLSRVCPCLTIEDCDGINHAYDLGRCKRCYIRGRMNLKAGHSVECRNCKGTGWVAAEPSLELAHEALWSLGIMNIEIIKFKDRKESFTVWARNIKAWATPDEVEAGIDELEATLALAVKVVEKEKA